MHARPIQVKEAVVNPVLFSVRKSVIVRVRVKKVNDSITIRVSVTVAAEPFQKQVFIPIHHTIVVSVRILWVGLASIHRTIIVPILPSIVAVPSVKEVVVVEVSVKGQQSKVQFVPIIDSVQVRVRQVGASLVYCAEERMVKVPVKDFVLGVPCNCDSVDGLECVWEHLDGLHTIEFFGNKSEVSGRCSTTLWNLKEKLVCLVVVVGDVHGQIVRNTVISGESDSNPVLHWIPVALVYIKNRCGTVD